MDRSRYAIRLKPRADPQEFVILLGDEPITSIFNGKLCGVTTIEFGQTTGIPNPPSGHWGPSGSATRSGEKWPPLDDATGWGLGKKRQ